MSVSRRAFLKSGLAAAALTSNFALADIDPEKSPNKPEFQYVDMHAILLIDVSSSMELNEISRSTNGLFMYLTSDEAKQDYAHGTAKAVTLIYFAGEMHVTKTQIISNVEDAKQLIETYLRVVEDKNIHERISLSNGILLADGTNVDGVLNMAGKVFDREDEIGIQTERRIVLVVGDDVPAGQIENVRRESDRLTLQYGARVCAVSVHDGDTPAPDYHELVTVVDPETLKPKLYKDQYGFDRFVEPCEVTIAGDPKAVQFAVSRALGMNRF